MIKMLFFFVCVVFSLVCSGSSKNLLINAGFEQKMGNIGWRGMGNFYRGKGKAEITEINPASGKKCLEIKGFSKNSAYQLISSKINVVPNSVMALSFAVRRYYSEDIKNKGYVQVRFFGKQKYLGKYGIHIRKQADSPDTWLDFNKLLTNEKNVSEYIGKEKGLILKYQDFKSDIKIPGNRKLFKGLFKIPKGVEFIRVYLISKGVAKTYFDDISLRLISSETTLPAPIVKDKREVTKRERGTSIKENKKILGIADNAKNSDAFLNQLDKLEMQRLLFERGNDVMAPKKISGWTYEIVEPELVPAKYLPEGSPVDFPVHGQKIKIKNGIFYRNGKPAYLLSYENTALYNYWFWQAAGIDVAQMAWDFYIRCSIKNEKDEVNKKIIVRALDYPIASFSPPLTLASGVAPYLQPCESNIPKYYRKAMRRNSKKLSNELLLYRYCPELYLTNGHYISYRPGNLDAEKIRKNAWRQYLNRASRFPVFACETFNELYYMDYSKDNLVAFDKQLKNKFPNIEQLNQRTDSHFKSWDSVIPPLMKATASIDKAHLVEPDKFSAELWTEWVKFTEKRAGTFLKKFKKFVVSLAPNMYVTIQPRPSADFDGQLVGSDFHQIIRTFDFYAHEYGAIFYKTLSGKDVDSFILRRMVHSRIRLESTRLACELAQKPIFNVEGKISGGVVITEAEKKHCEVLSLDGEWKFIPDEKKEGVEKGFFKAKFDDAKWDKIVVPGIWSAQGKKNYTSAWYRKKVQIPQDYTGKTWLCGFKLSDRVNIYINEQLVHSSARWNDKFNVDVTAFVKKGEINTFAIQFFVDGIGGIREYLKLSKKSFEAQPLQPEQLRAGFWTNIIHGTDGDAMSYRGPRGRFNAFVNPGNTDPKTIANIPVVKAELDALASLIMPKPRFPSQIGIVLSMDTKREILNKNALEMGKRFYANAFADYLGAAWWTGLGTETVTDELLRNGAWKRYRIIVMPLAWRIHPATMKALSQFVRDGGILIIGAGSIAKNDITGLPFTEMIEFMGAKWGAARFDKFSAISKNLSKKYQTCQFELNGATGREIIPGTAVNIMAKDDNGKPVWIRNQFGKGVVHTLGFHVSMDLFGEILRKVISKSALLPQLEIKSIKGEPCKYVERQVLGRDGRYLFYAQDYGGSEKIIKIKPVGFQLPSGKYKIRDTQYFQNVQSPTGKALWTSEEIKKGIIYTMKEQNPLCLLIEKADLKPLEAYDMALAKKRNDFLLKHFKPSPKADKIAYIPSVSVFSGIDAIPTARLIMENMGFQVDAGFSKGITQELTAYGKRKYPLKEIDILILTGIRFNMTNKEIDLIVGYVENGGSLLLTGMPVWGNNWHKNSKINKLLKKWEIKIDDTTLLEVKTANPVSQIAPVYNHFGPHPIVKGIKSICAYMPVSINLYSKKDKFVTLFSSSKQAENIRPRGKIAGQKPLAVAFKQGKGKVLVLGSAGMLLPEYLRKNDNAQFLINAVQWLTGQPSQKLISEKMKKLLEIPGRNEFIIDK